MRISGRLKMAPVGGKTMTIKEDTKNTQGTQHLFAEHRFGDPHLDSEFVSMQVTK